MFGSQAHRWIGPMSMQCIYRWWSCCCSAAGAALLKPFAADEAADDAADAVTSARYSGEMVEGSVAL